MGSQPVWKRRVDGLYNEDGEVTRDRKEVVQIAKDFWQEMFTKKPTDKFKGMANGVKTLSEESRQMLNAPILYEELWDTMTMLAKGKALGCDGMPTDVYRTWPRMVKCLAEAWASRQDLSSMGG